MEHERLKKAKKKNKTFAIVLIVLIIIGSAFGVYKYIQGQRHVETDDAQVEANISPITPKVSGFVKKYYAEDNQHVNAGDTLVVLDDRDFIIKVKQAETVLAYARANVQSSGANLQTAEENVQSSTYNARAAEGNIELAKVKYERAESDYKRYAELIKTKSVTDQQFEQAKADRDAAASQLEVAKRQFEATTRETSARKSQAVMSQKGISLAEALMKEREADLAFAKLQLSYCYILAPISGTVSKKNVQVGQLVQAGQSLYALVDDQDKWVVANYKETQVEKMKVGQTVELEADAFSDLTFIGKIESISPATGAKFSLLPPDNSSGNFVKIVQRIPVKIVLDKSESNKLLRAGMNVIVDVHLK
ncbi:MAG: Membrane fusion component of MSF-type tripartite multidrug efflux system [Cytophagales bacterium]|jgi:membrane fusion protein (multidrug efflux system)|nr:HlyD family secretion protein [Bacteroidota bacterium]MBS1981155.1 HlyD family secretion protein [Bacteroidota bacterium]WHZ06608.1 MAG: Membrane fusion component of MSF-type tripartite multidrug efflux system [Cytophagales bacterium]